MTHFSQKIFNFVHVLKRLKIAADYMGMTRFFSENFQLCTGSEIFKNHIKVHVSVRNFCQKIFNFARVHVLKHPKITSNYISLPIFRHLIIDANSNNHCIYNDYIDGTSMITNSQINLHHWWDWLSVKRT